MERGEGKMLNMILTNIYIGVCLLLALYKSVQHRNGRAYPFILITLTHAFITLLVGSPILWDGYSVFVGMIAGWIVLSLLWGDQPHNAVFSVIQWLATFYFLLVARSASIHVIAWIVFTIASVYAAIQMYTWITKTYPDSIFVFFGNFTHNAIYYLIGLVGGVWLMQNLTPYLLPFNVLVAFALLMSGGRAGIIAGMFAIPAMFGLIPFLVMMGVGVCGLVGVVLSDWWGISTNSKGSIYERGAFTLLGLKLFWKKPIFGWGQEAFRRNVGKLASTFTKPWEVKLLTLAGGIRRIKTHRVHCDIVELLIELGVVGVILFILPFLTIPISPLYIGILLAVGVNGVFFFPLREIHSSLPFWAIVGVCSSLNTLSSPLLTPTIFHLIVCGGIGMGVVMVGVIVWEKWMGLRAFAKAMTGLAANSRNGIQEQFKIMLRSSPHDSIYLTQASAFTVPESPLHAFLHTTDALIHYDGETVPWELYHQFATLALTTNIPDIAKWALTQALTLNPDFTPSREVYAWVDHQERVKTLFKTNVSIGGLQC